MHPRKVNVGLIQMGCTNDKQANLDKTIEQIRKTAKAGAQVICLQELFASTYFCWEENYDYFGLAEAVPGMLDEVEDVPGEIDDAQYARMKAEIKK